MSEDMTPFEESGEAGTQRAEGEPAETTPYRYSRLFGARPWAGGLVLVAIGLIFLLRNAGLDLPILDNWWALLILFPAAGALGRALQVYQSNGQRWTSDVVWSLIGGLAITLVALTFLLDVSWSLIWPVYMILAGLGALLSTLFTR